MIRSARFARKQMSAASKKEVEEKNL